MIVQGHKGMEKLEALKLTAVEESLDELLERIEHGVALPAQEAEYLKSGVREAKYRLYLAMREALSEAGVVA